MRESHRGGKQTTCRDLEKSRGWGVKGVKKGQEGKERKFQYKLAITNFRSSSDPFCVCS